MSVTGRREIFAKRLRALRENKGLTQKEVGSLIGITDAAVGMWEQGRRLPDAETMARLAEIFGVTVNYLLGIDDSSTYKDPSTLSWWYRDTPPTDVELEEFLKNANVHFDGTPLTEEDKDDIIAYLRFRWEREKKKERRRIKNERHLR